MKKKLIAALICLAMVLALLPATALAYYGQMNFEDAGQLTEALAQLAAAQLPGASPSNWDGGTKTLYLNGIDFTFNHAYSPALVLPDDATIALGVGTVNTITCLGDQDYCINCDDSGSNALTITGAGTLNLVAPNKPYASCIQVEGRRLVIGGGAVVNMTAGASDGPVCIYWGSAGFSYLGSGGTFNGSAAYNDFSHLSASKLVQETGVDIYYYMRMSADGSGDYAKTVRLAHNDARVAAPVMSVPGGSYSGTQRVTLSCATPYYTAIRYTLDGSEPTATSPLYTGAITINATTTLKARAFATGIADSAAASETYTLPAPPQPPAPPAPPVGPTPTEPAGVPDTGASPMPLWGVPALLALAAAGWLIARRKRAR